MPPATANRLARDIPPLRAPYAPPDETIARDSTGGGQSLGAMPRRASMPARRRLVEAIRARTGGLGGIEDFLHAYALSTKEGLALMVLAEALLRVPDAETADRLIEDKLQGGRLGASRRTLGVASGVGVSLDARPHGPRHSSRRDAGRHRRMRWSSDLDCRRCAQRRARPCGCLVRISCLGRRLKRRYARAGSHREFLYSFRHAGRGRSHRRRRQALLRILMPMRSMRSARAQATRRCQSGPEFPSRLSALHPRYEPLSRDRVLDELVPKLLELAQLAKRHELNFTIDAEEADRLELSLDVIAAMLRDSSLAGWDGFGLAIQAYQKRAGRSDRLDRRRGGNA